MSDPAAEQPCARGGRREVADPNVLPGGSATADLEWSDLPITNRQLAAAFLTPDACPWCGVVDCPDTWYHQRLDAMSETTWRRRAR